MRLRISTEGVGRAAARGAATAGVTVGVHHRHLAHDLPRRGRAAGQGRRVPAHRGRADRRNYERVRASAAPTTSRCAQHRPRASANRRWCRRTTRSTAASTSSASPSPTSRSTATAAISCWCRCPASPTSRARRTSSVRRRSSSSSWSKAGRRRRARRCSRRTAARCRRTWKSSAAPPTRRAASRARCIYLVRKVAAVNGSDLRSASVGLDENSRPAVMFSLKPDGARKFGQVTGSNIGRSLAIVLDDRVQSVPAHRRAHQRRGPHLRQLHAAGSRGSRAQAALRRAAGVDDLSRGARRRPDARRRLDPLGRDRRRWPASCSSSSSCSSTTSSRASTRSWRWSST